jgi:hypothetical protein
VQRSGQPSAAQWPAQRSGQLSAVAMVGSPDGFTVDDDRRITRDFGDATLPLVPVIRTCQIGGSKG